MTTAYLRVSTDKQNLDNQRDEIARFASDNGLIVEKWVTETVSGKTDRNKRKLGSLLRRLRKGDILIVSEISRLSRSLMEVMTIVGGCIEKGISIYTVKEQYRFEDSINSKVLCFAFGLVAEIERNLISMRTKEALERKKSAGIQLGRRKGDCPKIEMLSRHREHIENSLAEGATLGSICRQYNVSYDTLRKFRKAE